ncbi:MAG: DMT family transporter [bacterium]
MPYLGECAALATALLWAFTSIFFAEAGKRIGSFQVNLIRLVMAVTIYSITLILWDGRLFPAELNSTQVGWLAGSGLVGLLLGDGCGFKALVMIGPRLTSLLYASAPIWTTVIAWVFLGEQLTLVELVGIALTVSGITWVVLERRSKQMAANDVQRSHPDSGTLAKGVLLGIAAAMGQAVGLVLAKQGMFYAGGTVAPMSASYIRMLVALGGITALTIVRGDFGRLASAWRDRKALGLCGGGAVVGPFLGVWMSLVAVKYIATGVAATLNSMTPVMILPLVFLFYREKVTLRAALGAVIAVAGTTILFLSS